MSTNAAADRNLRTNTEVAGTDNGAVKRLRILVVASDTYPPSRVDVATLFGVELSGRGHKIDWILQSERACASGRIESWGGGRVWVGPTDLGTSLFSRIRKHVRGIANDLKLFALLRTDDYEFIEVKDKFISGMFAATAAWLYGKTFIYWLSYPFGEGYLLMAKEGTARYPILYVVRGLVSKFLLYKLLLPVARHVFVQSEQMRLDVAMQGIPLEKMTAVPMGIKADSFSGDPGQEGRVRLAPGERCFLYLGTLARVRHLDFLVRVLARVKIAIPDVKLYFVGSGDDPDDEAFLLREARRLGVAEAIVFTGKLPHAEALSYVREANVCVSPFYPTPVLNSTSPTKLVEYMAAGKAVVATDHPEQRRLIEDSGAGYCVPYEESAFADAIVKVLESPDNAILMGRRGRQYVLEHRSYSELANLVESTFMRVAAERSRGVTRKAVGE
jgi:glycosyltransferase involved in cell wall biosynthesis